MLDVIKHAVDDNSLSTRAHQYMQQ